jgi:hypothetical protein
VFGIGGCNPGMEHGSVNHSAEEYVRAYFWHTNTAEGYFSILKRGIMGRPRKNLALRKTRRTKRRAA